MSFLKSPKTALTFALVALLAVSIAYVALSAPGSVTSPVPSKFTVNGRTFAFTYAAATPAERAQGLMNRKIVNTTTMLFAYPSPGKYSYWMYDTNTSLDMLWVNATGDTGIVVYLASSVPPCYLAIGCPTYAPTSPANYVIEAKAGFAVANGIEVGTQIEFA
jgi:uncharacterized protein